jgi:hypothetical protein
MLRAGFAKVDITPGPDANLIGYEFRQTNLPPGNTGVHDPLFVRVLVIDDGTGKLAAIVSLDHCILMVPFARQLRRAVAGKLKTSADRVLVSCTHTHSGPFYQRSPWLQQRVVAAAAQAAGLTYQVTVTAQYSPLGLGYNRRVATKDGIRHCWNPQEFPNLNPGPSPDPTCTVAVLRQINGRRQFVLWNVGAHPVVLGKTSRVISADWPGRACQLIDESGPATHSLFLLGACGDIHPWIATQEDPAQIEPVARTAAGMVTLLAQADRAQKGAPTGTGLRIATKTWRGLDLAMWNLAGVQLAAAPVELFSELSVQLRQQMPGPLLIATNTNGWTGYWPTRTAFAEGGYEVDGARAMGRKPGDGEKLVAELAKLVIQTGSR